MAKVRTSDGYIIHPNNKVWILARKSVKTKTGDKSTFYYPLSRVANGHFFRYLGAYHKVFMFQDNAKAWCDTHNPII